MTTKPNHLGHSFRYMNRDIPSTVNFMNYPKFMNALNVLLIAMNTIEEVTGFKWRITSFIRDSPSHMKATSLDIAPDIDEASKHAYAVTHKSDPVLYKRTGLIKKLVSLQMRPQISPGVNVMIFIEPDHLHLNLAQGQLSFEVIKWGVKKYCYKDTDQRSALPNFLPDDFYKKKL